MLSLIYTGKNVSGIADIFASLTCLATLNKYTLCSQRKLRQAGMVDFENSFKIEIYQIENFKTDIKIDIYRIGFLGVDF
jgi:hypothetical protein